MMTSPDRLAQARLAETADAAQPAAVVTATPTNPRRPDMTDFQERGEALRRRYGIDGTAGDAQDVPHPYHRDDASGACLVCGLAEGYRKHTADAARLAAQQTEETP